MNRLDNAREKLADRILEDFKEKITGKNQNYVINENPENCFFVGKLLTTEDDNNSYSSDVLIDSLGADFYVSENDFSNAKISIQICGDFYHRLYPSLSQQREAFLEEVKNSTEYSDFDSLLEARKTNPSIDTVSANLVPVYKKVSINDLSLTVSLIDLMIDDTYGIMDERHKYNTILENDLKTIISRIDDPNNYIYPITEKTGIFDLMNEENYQAFITAKSKKDVTIRQNWHIYLYIKIKRINSKYLVSVSLVNDSKVHSNSSTHKSNKKAKSKNTIETLFNSGLIIKLENANFVPIDMDFFIDDYKYDNVQYAVGNNCSVIFDHDTNTILTENLPTYIQNRLITNDDLAVKFSDLANDPIAVLNSILNKMNDEHKKWNDYYKIREKELTVTGKKKMKEEIQEFEREIKRFEFGIEIICNYNIIKKSFVLMNQSFERTSKKYNTWRLFQIVFIVSLIPDIAACDSKLLTVNEKKNTNLEKVSLLYFPTGGGKTEAFFGVLVFNLFFDRYRGKEYGVTSILRYPLRLLSVQQVQRLANTLAQAELLRRRISEISGSEEFSLGYFVGDANTPNKITEAIAEEYKTTSQQSMDEKRIIDICPFCGKHSVHLKFDEQSFRLMHFCDNPECESGDSLPIYMVDTEIYRKLPSAIISTVDKLAILGNNANFRNILSGSSYRCPKHGFCSCGKCIVGSGNKCDVEAQQFIYCEPYDPAPTLFIQDELHLIRESLGTYAAHYESFISYFVKNISPSKRNIKVIGATATISSYDSQIYHLYNRDAVRFPCASPFPDKNFYSFINKEDIQRRILGFAPYGKAIINSVVYTLKYMRQVVNSYVKNPEKVRLIENIGELSFEEINEILEDYWIFLEYNNVKRDGNNVEGALETPINVELKREGIIPFKTRKMTGDETFQDVREVLAEVEGSSNIYDGVNLIVATSMISHGVDADRFNIMFFYGMPGNTAEYIQAYSRTGRRYSSIVVDIMRPSRETDQSYLRNFIKFHEFKDIMVESVPINRWATKAISNTLPGLFMGLILNEYHFSLYSKYGSLYQMKNVKSAIQGGEIKSEDIKNKLYKCYGCVDDQATNTLGNQYRKVIDMEISNIFDEIVDRSWADEWSSSALNQMGYHIMTSLRDTDAPLIIELEAN
jgi:hypothetical protein